MYDDCKLKSDVAEFIQEETGLKKTQAYYWAKKIYDEYSHFENGADDSRQEFGFEDQNIEDEPTTEERENLENLENLEKEFKGKNNSDLEFSDKYLYVKDKDLYIFFLQKQFGKNINIAGNVVRSLIKNYSNYDGDQLSINQVAIRYAIPRNVLIHVLKILGITHDSLPITPEEYEEKDVNTLKEETIENKKFALYQKLQKEDWKITKENARKWDQFVVGKLNPFEDVVNQWSPPEVNYTASAWNSEEVSDDEFLVILTDTHIGSLVKYTFNGGVFDTKQAVANILSYLDQIQDKLARYKRVPSKAHVVYMGDILNSFVDGETRHKTKLENDYVNGELFKIGLDVIVTFTQAITELFPAVNVHCVKGNHDSDLIYGVYYAAKRYFEKVDSVMDWKISDYWIDTFKINNCYFIYTHGKDDVTGVSIPKKGKALESYVQSLLLSRSKVGELVGVESKYFITGHLHNYVHEELNDFEFIRVPASVNSDDFADSLGFRTKARQNCFIVGQDHIEDTLHIYF